MKLTNKDLLGSSIKGWTPEINPDGVLMWTHPRSETTIMATPHYDKQDEVPVDLIIDMNDDSAATLQTVFRLQGNSVEQDRKIYIAFLEQILSIISVK